MLCSRPFLAIKCACLILLHRRYCTLLQRRDGVEVIGVSDKGGEVSLSSLVRSLQRGDSGLTTQLCRIVRRCVAVRS